MDGRLIASANHKLTLGLLSLVFTLCAQAETPEPPLETISTPLPEIEITGGGGSVNRSRIWFGRKLDQATNQLDLFFAETFFGQEVLHGDHPAPSRGKFFVEWGKIESRELTTDVGFDLSITLPRTQDRLKLLVSSNDENENRVNEQTTVAELEEEEEEDVSARLALILDEVDHWEPSLEFGVRWSSNPESFVDGRLKSSWGDDDHRLTISESFAHFERQKLIITSKVNYLKRLSDNFSFRFNNRARYFHELHFTAYSHVPGIAQRITERNAMLYQVSADGRDDDKHNIDSYTASIRFRRRVHSTWLYWEIEPRHTWFVGDRQEPATGVFLRLEALVNE